MSPIIRKMQQEHVSGSLHFKSAHIHLKTEKETCKHVKRENKVNTLSKCIYFPKKVIIFSACLQM